MKSLPVGPMILPITNASSPDWLPKLITLSPSLTILPMSWMYSGSQVPEIAMRLETVASLLSTYILNPYLVATSFSLALTF